MAYEKLFSPMKLGPLELKNHLSMPPAATQFGLEGGYVSDKHVKWYDEIAAGGVGLVIIEAIGVHKIAAKFDRLSQHLENVWVWVGLIDLGQERDCRREVAGVHTVILSRPSLISIVVAQELFPACFKALPQVWITQ